MNYIMTLMFDQSLMDTGTTRHGTRPVCKVSYILFTVFEIHGRKLNNDNNNNNNSKQKNWENQLFVISSLLAMQFSP